jgi:hypothetical protein
VICFFGAYIRLNDIVLYGFLLTNSKGPHHENASIDRCGLLMRVALGSVFVAHGAKLFGWPLRRQASSGPWDPLASQHHGAHRVELVGGLSSRGVHARVGALV